MSAGLVIALSVHGAGAARSFTSLVDLGAFAALVQSQVRDDIRATYAVEVEPNKPPPPPPETPPPSEPEPQAKLVSRNPQAAAPPPGPAQAGKVLTAVPDPDAPLDLTGDGFVTGDGDRYVGGVTSAKGTSTTPVRQAQAKIGGKVGGTGNGKTDSEATKLDLSRAPLPTDTSWNDCGFPPEADTDQINFMRVRIMVTVGADGRAQKVSVLNDPGHGFGRQAQQCAFRKGYNVGLNSDGKPVVSTTPPFGVTFTR
jgi:protein TonB